MIPMRFSDLKSLSEFPLDLRNFKSAAVGQWPFPHAVAQIWLIS
jgi:hypothetical protein